MNQSYSINLTIFAETPTPGGTATLETRFGIVLDADDAFSAAIEAKSILVSCFPALSSIKVTHIDIIPTNERKD